MSVMTAVLRRHGATLTARGGRRLAAHFGSPASEAAVCRGRVGLAERSDRSTLEISGGREAVSSALRELDALRDLALSVRPSEAVALVRCDAGDADACAARMLRVDDVSVTDVSAEHVGISLVGPCAREVLDAAHIEHEELPVLVFDGDVAEIELLVTPGYAPALWNQLLAAGDEHGIACVGLEALEHLRVAKGLTRRRAAAV